MGPLVKWALGICLLDLIIMSVFADTDPCSLSLGLEDGNLRDSQYSASSVYDSSHNPWQARLNTDSGWKASRNDLYRYLKLDLEGLWNITKFAVQGASYAWFTKELRVFYSDDDLVWHPYNSFLSNDVLGEVITANQRHSEVKNVTLEPSIKARFIAFHPVTWYGDPSLRLELYGCQLSNKSSIISTVVDKDIKVDEIWTSSQSPVVISSQIDVWPSGSLTIQAGVVVIFTSPDAGLCVYGTLTSVGVGGVSVIFSGNYPVTNARNIWDGINKKTGGNIHLQSSLIRQASVGIIGGGSGFYLSNVIIHSCKSGIQISDGVDEENFSSILLQDSNVFLNQHGILLHGTKTAPYIIIQRSNMSNNDYNGVSIVNWDKTNRDVDTILVITDSHLDQNTKSGFETSDNIPVDITIQNCTFIQNSHHGVYYHRNYYYYTRPSNLSITLSNFVANKNEGIYLYSYLTDSTNVGLENNDFAYNLRRALYLVLNPKTEESVVIGIKGNTFSGHSSYNYPVEIQQSRNVLTLDIQNNTFIENNGCINVRANSDKMIVRASYNRFKNIFGSSRHVLMISMGLLKFRNNIIENATVGTLIEIGNGYDHVIMNNKFYTVYSVSCYVKVVSVFGADKLILASDNYWGTGNISKIKEKLCDFFLNAKVARVAVRSYYIDSSMTLKKEIELEDEFDSLSMFANGSNYYGGIINNRVIGMGKTSGNVFVNRSIIIEENGTLECFGNRVYFAENRGIIVKGQLSIGRQDELTNTTVLKSDDTGTRWSGIYIYGGRLIMANTNISSVDETITIKSTNDLKLEVRTTTVIDVNSFINARDLNGNFSVLINSSMLDLERETVLVVLNDTRRVDLQFTDSYLNSKGNTGVISITVPKQNVHFTKVNLLLQSSTLKSAYYWARTIFVESCRVHLNLTSVRSTFSSNYDIIYSHTQSFNFDVGHCEFLKGRRAFWFYSCEKSSGKEIADNDVNIYNNSFYLSSRSEHIYCHNRYYTKYVGHNFNIYNNHFFQSQEGTGRCISLDIPLSYASTITHNFTIKYNFFERYERALDIYGIASSVTISRNTFFNNSKVLVLNQRRCCSEKINFVNFEANTISHNMADGIIQLQPSAGDGKTRINVTRNEFVNNTGTIITTQSPHIVIRNNFFENHAALYNLKVLQGESVDIPLNATLNYWGSTNVKTIGTKIYDSSYDESLFSVVFRPYLGSRNMTDIQDDDASFIGPAGDIGGAVSESVNLTAASSPYLVTSNIEIREPGVLTVEEGVTLIFKTSRGISVAGSFHALGTASNPVHFFSEFPDEKWRGVSFASDRGIRPSTLHDVVVNNTLHGIIVGGNIPDMRNVISNFSQEHGFKFITHSASYDRQVDHLTAAHNTKSGVLIKSEEEDLKNLEFKIKTCLLYGNNEHGISIEANANVTLDGCDIVDNRLSGVYISQNEGGLTNLTNSTFSLNHGYAINTYKTNTILLESCSITKHNYGYYRWSHWYTRPYITISKKSYLPLDIIMRNNIFIDNIADGIHVSLDWYNRGAYNFIFENNIVQNGNRTLFIDDRSSDAGSVLFHNNILDNLHETISDLLTFYFRSSALFTMTQNSITNNTASTVIAINGQTNKISDVNISIHDNVFITNEVQTTIAITSHQNNISLTENVFSNIGSECELQAPDFHLSFFFINAKLNYWGEHTGAGVLEKVCGFEKNMAKSFVYYIPYYLDENLTEAINMKQDSFSVDGSFGGEVTGSLIFTQDESPYLISRSLMVREEANLFVEDGAVLQFKKDRGIYVVGSIMAAGNKNSKVTLQRLDTEPWYGVIFNAAENATQALNFTNIFGTKSGIVAMNSSTVISSCNISSSSGSGLSMHLDAEDLPYGFADIHIENTIREAVMLKGNGHMSIVNLTIQNSSGHGIYLSAGDGNLSIIDTLIENTVGEGILFRGNGHMSIVNLTIQNSSAHGIHLAAAHGKLSITDSTVRNCSTAIAVYFSAYYNDGNFSIENCKIFDNSKGVFVQIQNIESENLINVTNNYFFNNTQQSLHIVAPSYEHWWNVNDMKIMRKVDVGYNVFENSSDIMLHTYNLMNLSFHDNTIIGENEAVRYEKCMLQVYVRGNRDVPYRTIDISTNVFEKNYGTCVLLLEAYGYEINGTVFFNQFLSNTMSQSVVRVSTRHFNLSENIFDNPDSSFDLYVTKTGNWTIPASNNWWGSSNLESANNRIFDFNEDDSLLLVNITPILTDQSFDCSNVLNCSGNGECVRPNGCRCFSGWTGHTCTDYDCTGVNRCSGNGMCIGPNVCHCLSGWTGDECIYATCLNVKNCSGHGFCIQPDVCTCATDFTGNDCGSCSPFHWGKECQLCPACQNGFCDLKTGFCNCDGINWTGYLCERCNTSFYGPECLPLMNAINIIPNRGVDKGNTPVHVWGHNFPETSDKVYFCKFGTSIVSGTWMAWNHVVCLSPALAEGEVYLEVSPNGTDYTNNKLIYTFYATCPPGACGRLLNPPRGQCVFGSCSCNLPWTGGGCSVELYAPEIQVPPELVTVPESSSYSYQLTLVKGSTPVVWALNKSPKSMSVNARTGLVEWQYAAASAVQYEIIVTATNLIGYHTVSWDIMVPRSYSVDASGVEPNGTLPVPSPVTISGFVTFFNESSPRVVPVDIRVKSLYSGHVTMIAELTNPLQPTSWTATYYPRADDVGVFEAAAFHPAVTTSDVTVAWSVAGMRCEPGSVNVEKIIEEDTLVFRNISKLKNVGGSVISSIDFEISGLSGAFPRVTGSSQNESSQKFVTSLNADEEVNFDLVVTGARPLSGTIYVIFKTSEGTRISLRVRIRLKIRRPLLIFTPSFLSENVVMGTQKIIDITLKNEGEITARNLKTDLPRDDRLSLISFSWINQTESSDAPEKIDLLPAYTAIMSIAVTATGTSLGEMSGTIAVNSDLASATLRYKFYITSTQKLNLTFIVKDEYTYFASGAPLVSGAEVRLSNPRQSYSETRHTTNITGYVIFENIIEDQYTLYASADGHSSYSAIIIANPGEPTQDVFLQRVAVKYTWTVTPTTVEDAYIITLDSTYESFVPMPVVTIEPAKVNTVPYELRQADTIEFTITNHGLVAADNLRFVLPTNHPYLNFESIIATIGSIDANTTLIVPVKTTLKTVTKRNVAATAFCGLALLYDLDCGGLRTRNLDVTLTREYPGRPPLPCGIGGGGSGGGGGGNGGGGGGVSYVNGGASSSGSSVTYNPVTPLSCDCAKTLINSCALAYHPVAGCAVAVTDLGTCSARSGGDFILGALNCIVGVTDTAFACVFGYICKLCGVLYTTARCIIEAGSDCGDSRRRRGISSDVVDNLIQTTQPFDNFLLMMADIFGDKEMYDLNTTWYYSFKTVISDDSAARSLLLHDEANLVLNTLTDDHSKEILNKFLIRWNNTAAAWENGSLLEMSNTSEVIPVSKLTPRMEQYLSDTESSKQRGFSSIFEDFYDATNAYKDAEKQNQGSGKDDAVCAKVRVKIIQELVLTRDAFSARLEIENGENSALENINVEILITQTYGNGKSANGAFSIGEPSLIGISAVDGTGHLERSLSGSAEWLMVPYSHAAPIDDTQFDVGGRLSYSVGGSDFSAPLLPDTITVKPAPSLIVHYFHEKYVRGDDPLTTDIEPIVPFTLAVMVMNAGYGVARALKISSAQPEIIENEKGLLITFKITGSQIGNKPISPSLMVNFGDIDSFETKTARWLLTSKLKGTFYNYSATFENISPLGDPQLSLLDELRNHELAHVVRINDGPAGVSTDDDGLGDFLVNDLADANGIPDHLYNSANGSDVQPVLFANATRFIFSTTLTRPFSKTYKIVLLKIVVNASSWSYTRVINNITSPHPSDNEYLLRVRRDDHKDILVDANAWQTTHILDMFLFHMLDYINKPENETMETTYNLTFGQRNLFPPRFNLTEYKGSVPVNAPINTSVIKLDAYDIDKDAFHFRISNGNFNSFSVNGIGEIKVSEILTVVGLFNFEVIVKDYGIPSRSSSVIVTVQVSPATSALSTSTPYMSSTSFWTSTMTSTTTLSTGERSSTSSASDLNVNTSTALSDTMSSPDMTTSATSVVANYTELSSNTADPVISSDVTSSSTLRNILDTTSAQEVSTSSATPSISTSKYYTIAIYLHTISYIIRK